MAKGFPPSIPGHRFYVCTALIGESSPPCGIQQRFPRPPPVRFPLSSFRPNVTSSHPPEPKNSRSWKKCTRFSASASHRPKAYSHEEAVLLPFPAAY